MNQSKQVPPQKKHTLSTWFFLFAIIIATSIIATAPSAFAVPFDGSGILKGAGLPESSLESTGYLIIKTFLEFVGIIALSLIIYGGFTMMMGGTSSEKVKKGRDILFWAVIGILIILSSLGILEFLDSVI